MRKITRKGLQRKLDAIVKQIVILRDGKCVTCGSTSNLEPGHYFTRQVLATKWDLMNVNAQCHNCNLRHEYDPHPYQMFMLDKYGREAVEKLHSVFHHPKPVKTWQLEILRGELETVLKTYETEQMDGGTRGY